MEVDTVVLLQGICYVSFNLKRKASGMGSSAVKKESSLSSFELLANPLPTATRPLGSSSWVWGRGDADL